MCSDKIPPPVSCEPALENCNQRLGKITHIAFWVSSIGLYVFTSLPLHFIRIKQSLYKGGYTRQDVEAIVREILDPKTFRKKYIK